MYLAEKNHYQFWTNLHPTSVECSMDVDGECPCAYHVIKDDGSEIYSFQKDEYMKAAQKYEDLTKNVPFKINQE